MTVLSREAAHGGRPNFYTTDETLRRILQHSLDGPFFGYADRQLTEFGAKCAGELDERARHTDRNGAPQLIRYDKYGEEVSEVWVNEGYRRTVDETYRTGIAAYVHKEIPELGRTGNYTYSFAQGYVLSQSEPGFYCPVTLTMATAYLLDHFADDELKRKFLPHVCSTGETELFEGATFLTERQGGSDVGANSLKAAEENGTWRLYGEKYFASNAGMAGVAMVLARMEGAPAGSKGLTLFAVPWRTEDGSLNGIRIRRLKDKLGVRAVPSGEVEFDGAEAFIVGDPKNGLKYMMEALNLSRISNAAASVGIMRRAFTEALDYTSRRQAFGSYLTDYPAVRDTLVKLTVKQEMETAALFDLIGLYDRVTAGQTTEAESILCRLLIAVMKKETAEQAVRFAHEAIELHGGNGYIEDFVTPRLLRDAQVLTVWEGTANILALELIRLVNKFSGHLLFIDHLEQRQAGLPAAARREIAKLCEKLERFADYGHDRQTVEAKKLMEDMAKCYESVVASEWAERFGGRYALMAELYMEEAFGQENSMKAAETFDRIIR
ncbi:acyl-CoA dehydrogenase family protein [Indiicoccus explosivorum]|uniref:acyl-CoA dehydrogenase family protein n=1 Tax=Indiicoccus explosivorum TaxID=1917864 RepID=UPI000B42F1C3|nr:acyl-CoA dehydrogenase family protein [Indiicoccus explosivorum]